MSSFEQKIANYYDWTLDFTNKVIFEYERFLAIKLVNQEIYPSEQIEKIWKFHILCTEHYYNYCNPFFYLVLTEITS